MTHRSFVTFGSTISWFNWLNLAQRYSTGGYQIQRSCIQVSSFWKQHVMQPQLVQMKEFCEGTTYRNAAGWREWRVTKGSPVRAGSGEEEPPGGRAAATIRHYIRERQKEILNLFPFSLPVSCQCLLRARQRGRVPGDLVSKH